MSPAGERPARRPPKPVTRARLERIALAYLERFPAPAARLRQVLLRRVERAARAHPDTDRVAAQAWVEEVVVRCRQLGYVDDTRFAEARAMRLARSGLGMAAIRLRLAALGLESETIQAALAALRREAGAGAGADEAEIDPDLDAARTYLRKRRIGPWRPERERAEQYRRDLAALARRGFSSDTARRALDGEPED